jgi:hypothetical protein
LFASRCSIKRRDGIPDVLLILHQSTGGRLRIRLIADGGHDVVARPDDMVGPELAHVLLQRGCRIIVID